MLRRSRRHRGPASGRLELAIQLTCAAITIAALCLAWFDGVLAGPLQGREIPVVRLEPLPAATPLAVSLAAELAAREHGLLVVRQTASEPMPGILGECSVDVSRGSAGLAGIGVSPLRCKLPAFQRSWRQRFAGLVATSILVLVAAVLLLAGLGVVALPLSVTSGLALAVVSTIVARLADPSADFVWLWVVAAIAGCGLGAVANMRQRQRRGSPVPHPASAVEGPSELAGRSRGSTGAPGGNGAGDGAQAGGAVGERGGSPARKRDSISLAPLPEALDDPPERVGGLTPPTIGLPSRTARRGAIAAAEHPTFPDTMVDWGRIGDLELRAASARGASHRVDGRPRQDAFAVGGSPDGKFAIAAVADGVGSSDASQLGAAAAVRHGVAVVSRRLASSPDLGGLDEREVMTEVAAEMLASTSSEINGNGGNVGERIATTLVLAAVELDPGGPRTAWCARTGDSDARLLVKDGWQWIFAAEERSAIASSATSTLPLSPGAAEGRLVDLGNAEALVVFSDGLAKPLGSGRGAVGRFLARAWAQPPDPLEFAIQVQFRRRTFDDDRTAVVFWPSRSSAEPRR